MSMSTIEEILARVEEKYKHVIYNPEADKIWLSTGTWRLLPSRDLYVDMTDGNTHRTVQHKRLRGWAYLGEK